MKFNRNSIGVRLWSYFALLTVMILVLLWLLQTVFLQTFYDRMLMKTAESAADAIAGILETDGAVPAVSDFAYEHSMQVIVTDFEENIFVHVDEYSSSYQNGQNPYSDGKMRSWQKGVYRNLPEDYAAFLEKLRESADGTVSYEADSGRAGRNYICGRTLSVSGKEAALYINTPLGAVQSTVGILRTILLAVTGISLVIGLILAWVFAGNFARPIGAITGKARNMAGGKEGAGYVKGFCSELDELSETLDKTAESLTRLEHARRQMLANITHDLKTPLTLIHGYAEKISDLSCTEPEEARKDAEVIQREASRLTLLVSDILDYSALQAGSGRLSLRPVNISALAEKIAGQFDLFCSRNNIKTEEQIRLELYVFADEQRVSQVLYNLIANAVSHVGEDRLAGVRVFPSKGLVRVEVYDHGEGIRPEDAEHIWERYFTSRERKRSSVGTGLGLAIVKEILEAHQAAYGVVSGERSGSCFWFELKRCSTEAEAKKELPPAER